MDGALAPLRSVAFRRLTAGRVISMLGNAMAPIALAFAVLDLTKSVSDLGLVVGARSVANVIFVLVGGVVADRLPRHLVMVASSVLAGVTQAAVAAIVLTHSATLTLLIVLSSVNGMVAAFSFPAAAALLPQTITPDIRRQANAINRLGMNAALIAGSSVGGILVAAVGPGWGIAVDAATFVVGAVFFAFVRVPAATAPRDPSASSPGIVHELRIGWREFAARTWIWGIVLAFTFINAAWVGGLNVLGPDVADHTIGRRAWGLALAAQTLGMVLGGLVALRLKLRRLLLFGAACNGMILLPLLALGYAPHFWVLATSLLLAGFAIEQFSIAWDVSLQEHIAPDKLARVYSYDMLGSIIAIPVGQVAAGPLGIAIGTGPALLVASVTIAVATIAMLLIRDVRTLAHDPVHKAEGADAAPAAAAAAPPIPLQGTAVEPVEAG